MGTEMMPGGQSGPELGAQFAQLVKELRSEYGGAVTACAARIAAGVFNAPPGRSILRILQQHGITGTPTLMQQQVSCCVLPFLALYHQAMFAMHTLPMLCLRCFTPVLPKMEQDGWAGDVEATLQGSCALSSL